MDVKEIVSQIRETVTPEIRAISDEAKARQAELEKKVGELDGKLLGFAQSVEELRKLNAERAERLKKKAEKKRKEIASRNFAPVAFADTGKEPEGMAAITRIAVARAFAEVTGKAPDQVPTILRSWNNGKLAEAVEGRARALAGNSATAGGVFIPTPLSSTFADFLNAQVAVRRAGPVTIPMPEGQIEIPRGVSSATATYQEEAVNATSSDPVFGRIALNAKKVTAQTAISNDLIRRSPMSVEAIVSQNLLLRVALREDREFLFGTGVSSTPRGLRVLASNTQASAGTTLDNQVTDARRRMNNLATNNVSLARAAWFLHPRTKLALQTLRDAVGSFYFAEELTAGRFMGLPVFESTQLPINEGGGTNESIVILAAMDMVVVGDTLNLQIEAQNGAAYFEGGAVRSGFSRDETVIVVRHESDIAVYHPEAVAVTTGVTLGA